MDLLSFNKVAVFPILSQSDDVKSLCCLAECSVWQHDCACLSSVVAQGGKIEVPEISPSSSSATRWLQPGIAAHIVPSGAWH